MAAASPVLLTDPSLGSLTCSGYLRVVDEAINDVLPTEPDDASLSLPRGSLALTQSQERRLRVFLGGVGDIRHTISLLIQHENGQDAASQQRLLALLALMERLNSLQDKYDLDESDDEHSHTRNEDDHRRYDDDEYDDDIARSPDDENYREDTTDTITTPFITPDRGVSPYVGVTSTPSPAAANDSSSSSNSNSSASSDSTTIALHSTSGSEHRTLPQYRECPVCEEQVSTDLFAAVAPCRHEYACVSCTIHWCMMQLDEGRYLLSCMSCHAAADDALLERLLPPDDMAKLSRFRLLAQVRENPNTRWCPRIGCETAAVGDAANPHIVCPRCSTEYCFHCNQFWHPGACSTNSKQQRRLRKQLKQLGIIVCPDCENGIERWTGCIYVTCRCSCKFCSKCGAKGAGGWAPSCHCQRGHGFYEHSSVLKNWADQHHMFGFAGSATTTTTETTETTASTTAPTPTLFSFDPVPPPSSNMVTKQDLDALPPPPSPPPVRRSRSRVILAIPLSIPGVSAAISLPSRVIRHFSRKTPKE